MITDLIIESVVLKESYRIPIYQRNYAWGPDEVKQLIVDVADYALEHPDENYYLGSLVVYPRRDQGGQQYYEVIDGQQRLTTLSILACALRKNHPRVLSEMTHVNVSFDHRENSNYTLSGIFTGEKIDPEDVNKDIKSIYVNCWDWVTKEISIRNDRIKGTGRSFGIDDFVNFFLKKVVLLRVKVPQGTDLNHYFEIMNSRGVQLEQHEIVKARLMETLQDSQDEMIAFKSIWEACSDMDRYVQTNFSIPERKILFGDTWTSLLCCDFDTFSMQRKDYFNQQQGKAQRQSDEIIPRTLMSLISDSDNKVPYVCPWRKKDGDASKEDHETYSSIITFPNFLLHALKIARPEDESIILDDKNLITTFDRTMASMQEKDRKPFAKSFIMELLLIRQLFDNYIIKRKAEQWTLREYAVLPSDSKKRYYRPTFLKRGNDDEVDNKSIIMLLSMFHVSYPTQVRKHWMNSALSFVYNHPTKSPGSDEYKNFLESLARVYMLDIYLAGKDSSRLHEDVMKEMAGGCCLAVNRIEDAHWSNINIEAGPAPKNGEKVENFVFNYYDYLLWKQNAGVTFEYMYRTSVEHFYPQHPIDKKYMDAEFLHSFGNLCLVSRGINSKFSNNSPAAKVDNFRSDIDTYSLKLQQMMRDVGDNGEEWTTGKIKSEELRAKGIIASALQ